MKFGDAIQMRMNLLRKKGVDVPEILKKSQENATIRAIETAVEKTPPTVETIEKYTGKGSQLKEHWIIDSRSISEISGNEYKTLLANNLEYASYVNNGHHMNPIGVEMRFVPGEWQGNHFEYIKGHPTGIVVKQQWIEGIFMHEAAIEKYEEVLKFELTEKLKELYRNE